MLASVPAERDATDGHQGGLKGLSCNEHTAGIEHFELLGQASDVQCLRIVVDVRPGKQKVVARCNQLQTAVIAALFITWNDAIVAQQLARLLVEELKIRADANTVDHALKEVAYAGPEDDVLTG